MKNLYDLYSVDILVRDVKTNSKLILDGDVFVCINGVNKDRHFYIDDAVSRGACFLIVSRGGNYSVPYIKVKNTNKELIRVVDYLYNNAKKINIIATTGTDGKTSVSSILRDILGTDNCGYIGTNGIKGKFLNIQSDNTTPSIELMYKSLNNFYSEGLKYASVEISSEGVLHKRVEGLEFDVGIFTNFTNDHLNVHKNIDNYLKCKRKVFNKIKKDGCAVLNKDDLFYSKFRRSCKCKNIITYGKNKFSNLRILSFELSKKGTKIVYLYKGKKFDIKSPLLGEFNVYNLSAAICVLLFYGFDFSYIRKRVLSINIPLGRCEFLNYGTSYDICIDYAHTENGIYNILNFLNLIKKGKIISVLGSAGGRDKGKRAGMGKVSQELSDIVTYTMDDPRNESVESIINDMIDYSNDNYLIETNRKRAIFKALGIAKCNDIVVILGKGRDNYMAIGNDKVLYSDIYVLDNYFSK